MKKHHKRVVKTRPFAESKKDVHTEHCCVRHGCKYSQDFFCTVVKGEKPQSFICESCAHDGIINLESLRAVIAGGKPTCPHCNHILP
jgi:hypothetical protein